MVRLSIHQVIVTFSMKTLPPFMHLVNGVKMDADLIRLAELKELIHRYPRLSAIALQANIAAPELEIMIAMSDEVTPIWTRFWKICVPGARSCRSSAIVMPCAS